MLARPASVARFGWAILDQALFAGTSFIVNVVLARSLSPDDYGAFAVAYAVFLFGAALHGAIASEPTLVFGPGRFSLSQTRYARVVVLSQCLVGAVCAVAIIALAVVAGRLGHKILSAAFNSAGFATPFLLSFWTARRLAYARSDPRLAAAASTTYLAVFVAAALLLHLHSLPLAFTILAVAASFATAIVIPIRAGRVSEPALEFRKVVAAHWSYGRWAAVGALLSWIPDNAFYLLVPAWHGLAAAAELKIALLLVVPIINFMSAMSQVILPSLAGDFNKKQFISFHLTLRQMLSVLSAAVLVYGVVVVTLGNWAVSVIYGGRYSIAPATLFVVAAIPAPVVVYSVYGHALRAAEAMLLVSRSYLWGAIGALTVGALLTYLFATNGALSGVLIAYAVTSGVILLSYRKMRPQFVAGEDPSWTLVPRIDP